MHHHLDAGAAHRHAPAVHARKVAIEPGACEIATLRIDGARLRIALEAPAHPVALVLMVYAGKPLSRTAPAHYLARKLRARGFATALADLAPDRSQADPARRRAPSPASLAQRLNLLARWVGTLSPLGSLPMVCLATGEAAGAALRAAARGTPLRSLITLAGHCAGVRHDAMDALDLPVLMIAPSADPRAIRDNDIAFGQLSCPRQLRLVPTAQAGVEQPAELAAVVSLCAAWIEQILGWPRGAQVTVK